MKRIREHVNQVRARIAAARQERATARNAQVFNVLAIEVMTINRPIGGATWVQLHCHHSGDESPLIVQLPEQAWLDAVRKWAIRQSGRTRGA
jgi:hypothetical protein